MVSASLVFARGSGANPADTPGLANFTAALERQPESAEAYRGIGLAQRKLGNTGAATTAFRNYLKLSPEAADRIEIEGWIGKQASQ